MTIILPLLRIESIKTHRFDPSSPYLRLWGKARRV